MDMGSDSRAWRIIHVGDNIALVDMLAFRNQDELSIEPGGWFGYHRLDAVVKQED